MHWLVLMQVHPQVKVTCEYVQIQGAIHLKYDSICFKLSTAEPPVGDLVENNICYEISQETL